MAEPTGQSSHAVSPDGRDVEIKPGKEAVAETAGYRLLSDKEFAARSMEQKEGLTGAAKAFVENTLSTGTLGLSDVALGGVLGNEYRENRELRELAYPAASTAGEITGMVLPALVTGGAGAIAEGAEAGSAIGRAARAAALASEYSPAGLALRGGEAAGHLAGRALGAAGITGESLLGRTFLTAGKMAAGGAVEGAAFGAGGALSEAALAPDGDYNKLAHKLWAGAIEGAEFGALVGGGLGAGGELVGAAARKIGGTFSARRALEDFADTKSLKSAGFQGSDLKKLSPERRAELATTIRDQGEIGWLDSLGDRAKKLTEAKEETGKLLGTMRKQLDEIGDVAEKPQVGRVLHDAQQRALKLIDEAPTKTSEDAARAVHDEISTMRRKWEDKPPSFAEAHDLRRTIDDELTKYGKRVYPTSGAGRAPDAFEQGMMRVRTDLEHEFEAAAERVTAKTNPEFRATYEEAKARYGALKEVSGIANKRSGSLAGNRDISLTDTIAGAAGFAALGPQGMLLAAANKALRSTPADHIVGKLADALVHLDGKVSESMERFVNRSRRVAEGVAEGATARDVVRKAIKQGKEVGKVGTSSTLHVQETAHHREEQVKGYYSKLGHIEREGSSPPGTLVHVPGAPQIEKAAEKTRRDAIDYLLAQAPRKGGRIGHPMLARIARQTDPNPVDILKWMRKVETVENPMSVLRAMEQRRLTTDHVAALEATNQTLLEMFRRAALEKVTDKNADMAYEDRKQLGVLLGVVTDPSLRPESIKLSQSVYSKGQEPAQPQQAAPSNPGQRPGGINSRVDELEGGFTE